MSISRRAGTSEQHDTAIGPPTTQATVAPGISDVALLEEHSRHNAKMHSGYVKWSRSCAIVLNEFITREHARWRRRQRIGGAGNPRAGWHV